jgi:5-methylcytosine-specific restriction endonuclease McrA
MRIEIIIFLISAFLIGNVYTEGKFLKKALSYKKYYQMFGIAFGGLVMWWLVKKNPQKANEMFATSHEYLKYLPIDQNTSNVLSPILDFTSKQNFASQIPNGTTFSGGNYNMMNMLLPNNHNNNHNHNSNNTHPDARILNSGKKATKRSVSETKKKFVAAQQNWKCGDCGEQLSAWFEVDHKMRLEYGGSNHIDNLVALCRECHGKKTTIENL